MAGMFNLFGKKEKDTGIAGTAKAAVMVERRAVEDASGQSAARNVAPASGEYGQRSWTSRRISLPVVGCNMIGDVV